MLKDKGLKFDYAFTSSLSRAIKTLFYIQDVMSLHWTPVVRDWRLNERHYGALQGLNKAETAAKHGEEQVKVRSIAGAVLAPAVWGQWWGQTSDCPPWMLLRIAPARSREYISD